MCVICRKGKGKKLPGLRTIEDMWSQNPHGAGIMWREGRRTRYVKGFMEIGKFVDFVNARKDALEATECAMHFRIATHGGVNPENTHPFPMDRRTKPGDMEGLVRSCIMHNGILPIKTRSDSISDTAELSLRAKESKDPSKYLHTVAEYIADDNRVLAFMEGTTLMIGDWESVDGCEYSNLLFVDMSTKYAKYGFGIPRKPQGRFSYRFDRDRRVWRDAYGNEVPIEYVDPYDIDERDEEMYWLDLYGEDGFGAAAGSI